jgi:hypothetical protein
MVTKNSLMFAPGDLGNSPLISSKRRKADKSSMAMQLSYLSDDLSGIKGSLEGSIAGGVGRSPHIREKTMDYLLK